MTYYVVIKKWLKKWIAPSRPWEAFLWWGNCGLPSHSRVLCGLNSCLLFLLSLPGIGTKTQLLSLLSSSCSLLSLFLTPLTSWIPCGFSTAWWHLCVDVLNIPRVSEFQVLSLFLIIQAHFLHVFWSYLFFFFLHCLNLLIIRSCRFGLKITASLPLLPYIGPLPLLSVLFPCFITDFLAYVFLLDSS